MIPKGIANQLYDEMKLQMAEGDPSTDALYIDKDFFNAIMDIHVRPFISHMDPEFLYNSIDSDRVATLFGYPVVIENMALDVKPFRKEDKFINTFLVPV